MLRQGLSINPELVERVLMKKVFLLLTIFTICYLIFNIITVNAAPTPTAEPTQNIKDQLINNIASRVAQLKLVEKRGIIGEVSDISNTQITLSDIQNNTRFIDVDELTKFSSPLAKTSFGISDITKGIRLGVLGLYNKESRRTLARFVNVLVLPKFIHGEIAKIDSQNRTLKIITEDGKNTTIDIGNSTRILSYTKSEGLIRYLFSKIENRRRLIVVGFPDVKNKDIIIADRIILFPEVPIVLRPDLDAATISFPSTKSGKKVTPTTK